MARNSAGLWKAVAQAVDPKPPRETPAPVVEPATVVDSAPTEVESGQMMVPIDAWTRILEQVGHVHEAGQQLADARERAARAETENEFLKEQLRDLKSQKRSPRRPAAPSTEPAPTPGATSPVEPAPDLSSGRNRVRRARAVASRWLQP